ncbi:hypothetical protein TWF173_011553 [Orbilia oligospora]|nr:hypothetical protein TWF173_011553 [Orbilia oligospora]
MPNCRGTYPHWSKFLVALQIKGKKSALHHQCQTELVPDDTKLAPAPPSIPFSFPSFPLFTYHQPSFFSRSVIHLFTKDSTV